MTDEVKAYNKWLHALSDSLDDDSKMEITIKPNRDISVTLYNNYEKIGDFEVSNSLKTIGDLLMYVVGREQYLHKEEEDA